MATVNSTILYMVYMYWFESLFSTLWDTYCVSQASPKKQNQDINEEIYLMVLAYVIMEAEKSHDQLSASWSPSRPVVD